MLLCTAKRYIKDPVRINAGLLKFNPTYDFSTLLTNLPHNLIKENLLILLKELQ